MIGNSTVDDGLAAAVARLVAERDELARLNDLLVARLAELEDQGDRELLRRTYRKGYWAGRAASRRGAGAVTNPERSARGDLRQLLA